MLPADWEEYLLKAEQEGRKRPPDAPAPARPIKKHMSARQRKAFSQQANEFKAGFMPDYNPTPILNDSKHLTLNVGGNCEPDSPHGKDTTSRS